MRERFHDAPALEQASSHDDPHFEAFREAIRRAYDQDEPIPEALIQKAGTAFSKEAKHVWEQTMERVNEQVTAEYTYWKRKLIKTAQAAGISLVGLTGADYLVHAKSAEPNTVVEHAPDIRHTAATRAALTRATNELPPGLIRALVQTDIERAYGAIADGTWSVPEHPPDLPDKDAEQALIRFHSMLQAIESGSADALKQAIEHYAQAIAHLPDARRNQAEHAILQWHSHQL